MNRLWAVLAVTGCAGAGPGSRDVGAAGAGNPRVEIVQVTDRLLSAVRTRDTSLLRSLFLPNAVLVAVGRSTAGESVRAKTVDLFLRTVAGRQDAMLEQLRNPATRVDGDLAIVSGSYDAYAGKLSTATAATTPFIWSGGKAPGGSPPSPTRSHSARAHERGRRTGSSQPHTVCSSLTRTPRRRFDCRPS